MEVLQRLQPLDVLFAVLWACIVGWGLQSGVIRQIGMLVGVYGAAVIAGAAYRSASQILSLVFGADARQQLDFAAYVSMFVVVFGLIAWIIWSAYPLSRIGVEFGADNVFGAAVGAIWGVLLLIVLLTIVRFYTATPLRGQESSQQATIGQVRASQVAPVLQVVASPLWQALAPWFPTAVGDRV